MAPVRTFCYALSQANLDTLQKAVSEIRNELAQKKSESQADGALAASNSTPNLSPTGGTTAARDDARQGKDRLEFLSVVVAWFCSWFWCAMCMIWCPSRTATAEVTDQSPPP